MRPEDIFSIPNYNILRLWCKNHDGDPENYIHLHIVTPVLHSLEAVEVRFSMYGLGRLNMFSIYASPTRVFVIGGYEEIVSVDFPVITADEYNAQNLLWRSLVTNPLWRKLFDL